MPEFDRFEHSDDTKIAGRENDKTILLDVDSPLGTSRCSLRPNAQVVGRRLNLAVIERLDHDIARGLGLTYLTISEKHKGNPLFRLASGAYKVGIVEFDRYKTDERPH